MSVRITWEAFKKNTNAWAPFHANYLRISWSGTFTTVLKKNSLVDSNVQLGLRITGLRHANYSLRKDYFLLQGGLSLIVCST